MLVAHIGIFICIFFVMVAVVNMIPSLYEAYRKRYQDSSQRTVRELDRYFLNVKPTRILIGAAVLAAVLWFLSGNWLTAVAVMAAGAVAPKVLLSIWKQMRSAKFDAQLMDALLLISNSLRSGLDMVAGIERVATSMKAPISEEFSLVLNAYRLGAPLEKSLVELTERINSRTLETVVYSINIQRESGGNIIKTFEQLVQTIREEDKLQKKVRAITSQARSQIIFLAAFPWVLALFFYLTAPEMFGPALIHPYGQIVILILLAWEAVGIVVTKKIVSVDV